MIAFLELCRGEKQTKMGVIISISINLVVLLVFTIFLMLLTVIQCKIPALLVFGDSTVDTGNNNVIKTVLKSNFRPYGRDFVGAQPTGRFCNGRLPPDFISEGFGLKPIIPAYLDPTYTLQDFATGVCFASAGTGYDNATSAVLNVIPLWKEIEYYKEYQMKLRAYLGDAEANEIFSESLYLLSIGTNDWLENYFILPTRQIQFSPQEYEDFLIGLAENFLRELYKLGARKISISGLPPMGCLPLERTLDFTDHHGCRQEYNIVALEFNAKLEAMVARLNWQLPGIKILISSPYEILYDFITRPSLYGFEVTEKACCGTGAFEMSYLCNEDNPLTCKDARKYVFWDSFHPTEKTNQIISQRLLERLRATFT